ncbi:MAG: BON domain-containing protein, partial [Bryocella sp.]
MKIFTQRTTWAAVAVASVLLTLGGCKTTVDDTTISSNVKAALAADPSISQQPIQQSVLNGVVTLTGNVTDETASSV